MKHQLIRSKKPGLNATFALLSLCLTALALDPAHSITQYRHNSWTKQEDRLPSGITAIAQTVDGILWIGTDLGLMRFDGIRFSPWQSTPATEATSNSIGALKATNDGSLWIGTRAGLYRMNRDKLTNCCAGNRPTPSVPRPIFEAPDHTVWVGMVGPSAGGLCHIENQRMNCETVATSPHGVSALSQDRNDNLWLGGIGYLIHRFRGSEQIYRLPDASIMVSSLAGDGNEGLWVGTTVGLWRLQNDRLIPYEVLPRGQPFQPIVLLTDCKGGLWIGTLGQGLFHLAGGRIDRFTRADGLSADLVHTLFEDHEGNIWAGTANGLDRFRDYAVTTTSKREGLAHELVTSVFPSSTGVWVGTAGGLNHVGNGSISLLNHRDGLPPGGVGGLFEEPSGRLWVATNSGLAYRDGDRFHIIDHPDAPKTKTIIAAAEDRGHDVWFSDPEHGLLRFRDGQFVEVVPSSQFNGKQVWSIAAGTQEGELWLGFSPGGLAHWRQGKVIRWYRPEEGLPQGAIADLQLTRDGALFAATPMGLSRLDHDHISTLGKANGLPCDRVQSMVEDDSGAMWMMTTCGLVRVSGQDLAQWSAEPKRKVQPAVYDASEGMQAHGGSMGYFRHAAKSNDGKLWFSASEGVAVVDPKHLPHNTIVPPVSIERITADKTEYAVGSQPRLPPKTRDVEIDYTAYSFVAPERVQFRYRLEGLESEWHDAGDLRRAAYTNLSPKKYRFHVLAANNDGLWNNTGAFVDFIVLPAFYQTLWFEVLMVALGLLALWGLYLLRVRQLKAQMQMRYEARLAERTRISNDLHDDVLQVLSGFSMELDGLAKFLPEHDQAKTLLGSLREQMKQTLRDTRETIWDIRSTSSSDQDFSTALRESAEKITASKSTVLDFTETGTKRHVAPELAAPLSRIIREAIRNAVTHSGSRVIHLALEFLDRGALRITVSDEGKGFDLEEASRKMKHLGLKSMLERAHQIGAEMKIDTAPGKGVRIEVTVDLREAS